MSEHTQQSPTSTNLRLRRHYPRNNYGGKDEWHGLILHQSDLQEEIERTEKTIKAIKAKVYASELDHKLLENYAQHKRKLEEKLEDAQKIRAFNEKLAQENQQYLSDKLKFQEKVKNSIDSEVKALEIRKNEAKARSLEIDRFLLENDREKVQENAALRAQRRKLEENEGLNNLLLQNVRNQRNFNEKLREKREFNELTKRNLYKELQKEANYKNFWKNVAENQFQLYQMHKNQCFEPQVEKIQMLDEKILKDMHEAAEKREKTEKYLQTKKKQEYQDYTMANKEIIEQKNMMQMHEKSRKQQILQDFQKESQTLEEYDRFLREQKLQSQNSYREELDRQRAHKTAQIIDRDRMNRQEKLLNIKELHAFKAQDPHIHAKYPGWSPQIGNIGSKQLSELVQKVKESPVDAQKNRSFSEYQSVNAGFFREIPKSRDLIKRNLAILPPNSEKNLNFSGFSRGKSGFSSNTQEKSLNYGHNPIVNPTPFNVQNPYLRKELLKYLNSN